MAETKNDLDTKRERAAKLREEIAAEREKRESRVETQQETIEGAQLDAEVARLERELAEEKLLTRRQQGQERSFVADAKAVIKTEATVAKGAEKTAAKVDTDGNSAGDADDTDKEN